MEHLQQLRVFARVAELGSFSAAALELGLRQSTVSKAIAGLEAHFDHLLIGRTTRSFTLTEAGRRLHSEIAGFMGAHERLEAVVRGSAHTHPRLRVSAPTVYGHRVLLPAMADFFAQPHNCSYDIELNDRRVDPVAQDFDLVIRIGRSPDSHLRQRRLAHSKRRLVAAPSYLQNHGLLEKPSDLAEHDCLVHASVPRGDVWQFRRNAQLHRTHIRMSHRANDSETLLAMAKAGLGVAVLADWLVDGAIEQGELSQLLPDYELPKAPIVAISSTDRRRRPGRQALLRHLINVLN